MAANIQDDLIRMLQTITINAHYPCYVNDLNILVQYEFYFDICQIIFPWFNIKLIKIKQNQELNPGQKMQKLIQLLSQQLEIDLSSIKGEEIMKSHILHVHRFLQVLQKFSEHYQSNSLRDSGSRRAKSDPNTSQRIDDKVMVPRSARQKIKKQLLDRPQQRPATQEEKSLKRKQSQNRDPSYSAAKKEKRSKTETRKNLYNSMINIIVEKKNRAMMASLRDNRKMKNQQIIQAKNKYKSYLTNYTKQNRAAKHRQTLARSKTNQNLQRQLPLQDFDNIEDYFKSFEYKLRDQKYCYLKRIQKLIKSQEIDRMCYYNKIEQERNKHVKKSTKKQLDRIQNEHKIRSGVLQQEFEKQKQSTKLMKKQVERQVRSKKKQMKQNKKKELQKIIDFMHQQNGKVLVNLEQGGRLQKIILDMYKRF